MHPIFVLSLAIAVVSALPAKDPTTRIVGGSATTINQYPYAVALLTYTSGGYYYQVCGGTILNNRSVLTAAHCFVTEPEPWQWRSRVGSTYASSGGSEFATAKIIQHPNYKTDTSDMDFAVLHIAGTFTFSNTVQPANIAGANYNLADNQEVWAIGWGETCSGECGDSNTLLHVQVWTVNQAVCRKRYAKKKYVVTDNMLCSGWLDVGGRDQCQGDSGGPLIHNNVVVGVCSWGHLCAQARFPGVNARVSVASNWIVANA